MPRALTYRRIGGLSSLALVLGLATGSPAQEAAPTKPGRPASGRGAVDAKAEGKADPKADAEKAGEGTKAVDVDKPAEADKPPGLFGDPKKFSRYGGWGSMGGMVGQFGMARSMLVNMPAVQEELKLTAEQKDDVKEWSDDLRNRGQKWAESQRKEQQEAAQGQGEVSIAARLMQFGRMMDQVGEALRENEAGLDRILKPSQRKRLGQIALQMEGAAALTRPEVAEEANLGPVEVEMIQQVVAEGRTAHFGAIIQQFRGRSRQAPDQAESPRAETKGEAPAAEAPRARPDQDAARRKQFEAFRSESDRIQDDTTRAILKVLSKGQRARFDRMLGPTFDPSKVNSLGQGFRRGGPAPEAAR